MAVAKSGSTRKESWSKTPSYRRANRQCGPGLGEARSDPLRKAASAGQHPRPDARLASMMPAMNFAPGIRVHIPGSSELQGYVRIELAIPTGDGWQLFVEQPTGSFQKVELT